MRCRILALVATALSTFAYSPGPSIAADLSAVLEPGVVTDAGNVLLPVRLSRAGESKSPRTRDLAVDVGGAPFRDWDFVAPSATGSPGAAVFVLVDPSRMSESERERWAQHLFAFVDREESGQARAVLVLDGRTRLVADPDRPIELAEMTDRLVSSDPGPLWDGMLEAISRLSRSEGLPERRVLVLIAAGVESVQSRHPSIACADAADAARVAVYAVLSHAPDTEATNAGAARLRLIAQRTGGGFFGDTPSDGGEAAFGDAVAAVGDVRVMKMTGLEGPWPLSVSVRARQGPSAAIDGTIRPRRPVGGVDLGVGPWAGILIGVLVVGVAAGLLGYRSLPVGRLVYLQGARGSAMSLKRTGATLGGATGNTLVIAHERVSRNHAVIRVSRGSFTLTDLGSTNGTTVNGKPMRVAELRSGDRIELGGAVELRFETVGFPFRHTR